MYIKCTFYEKQLSTTFYEVLTASFCRPVKIGLAVGYSLEGRWGTAHTISAETEAKSWWV
jgi:hypothetical protein